MNTRHAWDKLELHRYRCTRCGLEKHHVEAPHDHPFGPPRWVPAFLRDGRPVAQGKTPPCPGAQPIEEPPRQSPPDARHAPAPVPWEITLPTPALRPVRAVLPLLAGPPDRTADVYRAWLASGPRPVQGGCGYCRHCGLRPVRGAATVCCRHPLVSPAGSIPIEEARRGSGFLPGGRYDEGGPCGLRAALFERAGRSA